MFRTVRRAITGGSLIVLTVIVFALAKYLPDVWFSFYPELSRKMLSVIGKSFGVFPFCVWEVLLGLLLLWGIVSLIRAIGHKHLLRWLAGVFELAAALLFVFVFVWGLNHFGPTAAQKLGLPVRESSVQELTAATKYYAELASRYAPTAPRAEDGTLALPSVDEMSKQALDDYAAMNDPLFVPAAPRVKPLLTSRLFSYMGITGIFVDLTGEANINTETYYASMPFTVCHELAHSCAIAAEDDANYYAFLVCEQSSDPLFLYSGYYSAYLYCDNALYKADASAARSIYDSCDELLKQDLSGSTSYYAQFEGPVKEAADTVNDTYLKTFGEEKGVQSYGAVTDMLIAHWLTLQSG